MYCYDVNKRWSPSRAFGFRQCPCRGEFLQWDLFTCSSSTSMLLVEMSLWRAHRSSGSSTTLHREPQAKTCTAGDQRSIHTHFTAGYMSKVMSMSTVTKASPCKYFLSRTRAKRTNHPALLDFNPSSSSSINSSSRLITTSVRGSTSSSSLPSLFNSTVSAPAS